MIVGGGMIARAMPERDDAVIYAAGVADSGCRSELQFMREKKRLAWALAESSLPFVYFGTCSIYDEDARYSPYVQHKAAMEKLVRERGNSLILRLPIVAGAGANPHTLLAYLRGCVLLGKPIRVWTNATRNVVAVRDVGKTVDWLLNRGARGVINVGGSLMFTVTEIVRTMEWVFGTQAKVIPVAAGNRWTIPADRITLRQQPDDLRRMIEDYYL